VTVVAAVEPNQDTKAFFAPMTAAGVEAITLSLPGKAYLRERRGVRALLERLGPDVLHTHGYRSDVLHAEGARRRGIATATTLHGFSNQGGLTGLGQWLQLRALRRCDAVIAVARSIGHILEKNGVPEERVHYIPNAWRAPSHPAARADARARLGLTDRTGPVLGWVGRLETIKGADLFLDALGRLTDLPWTACIIGAGSEKDRLVGLTRDLGLEERVIFPGVVADATRYFSAFDLLVLSSRSEGTPMVLLEAMGARVPVVATAVGGVPDLMGGSDTGLIVPPGSPPALADAIQEVLRDPHRARARAERACHRAKTEYSYQSWLMRHEEAYAAAIAQRRAAR